VEHFEMLMYDLEAPAHRLLVVGLHVPLLHQFAGKQFRPLVEALDALVNASAKTPTNRVYQVGEHLAEGLGVRVLELLVHGHLFL
jgi:hypothetical protein